MQQITNSILLIRPRNIRANEQTSANNYYQKEPLNLSNEDIQKLAQKEFNDFVKKLTDAGINALVFDPKDNLDTPDSHFPNNWISFHSNGTVVFYPMFAENRRKERRTEVLEFIKENGFIIKSNRDYSNAEIDNLFLEGTGSLVLDRPNKKAYCALSTRSDKELALKFCYDFDYTPILFHANQTVNGLREAIYHTNVMMCIAETFVVICLNSIDNKKEKEHVLKHLKNDKRELIDISEKQVENFAGNLLQVRGCNQESYLIMSTSAFNSFTIEQKHILQKHNKIIHSPLEMIETCGGGSARCLMAEIFLPKNKKDYQYSNST